MPPKPKRRGTPRPTAGRKPTGPEPRVRLSITLLPETIRRMDEGRGDESRSVWIERALERP